MVNSSHRSSAVAPSTSLEESTQHIPTEQTEQVIEVEDVGPSTSGFPSDETSSTEQIVLPTLRAADTARR